MYNTAIRESILESNKLPFLIFAKVCKHLPSPEYAAYTENILFTTKEQVVDIERNTRGQSQSKLWLNGRQSSLTASHFGTVMEQGDLAKFYYQQLIGNSNEHTAIQKYLEERRFIELLITACVQCGLIINTEAPWLGGSPDCLLHGSAEPTSFGIGEVKCPFSEI